MTEDRSARKTIAAENEHPAAFKVRNALEKMAAPKGGHSDNNRLTYQRKMVILWM
jgi:hypothetical protein